MKPEKNWANEWLTEKLYRDVIFRVGTTACIAIVTLWYSAGNTGWIHATFLGTKKLANVANFVGSISLILVFVGLLFKELEFLNSKRFGQQTTIGRIGAFVRRAATDFSIWTLNQFVFFLMIAALAVCSATSNLKEASIFFVLYGLSVFIAVLLAITNILIRRADPTLLIPRIGKPWVTVMMWAAIICGSVTSMLIHK